jgi:hypothetical protein
MFDVGWHRSWKILARRKNPRSHFVALDFARDFRFDFSVTDDNIFKSKKLTPASHKINYYE